MSAQIVFDNNDLKKQIFGFLGKPLPANGKGKSIPEKDLKYYDNYEQYTSEYCGTSTFFIRSHDIRFNYCATTIYFRLPNNKISFKRKQLSVKCLDCKKPYFDTGYPKCGKCYEAINRRYEEERQFRKSIKGVCQINIY